MSTLNNLLLDARPCSWKRKAGPSVTAQGHLEICNGLLQNIGVTQPLYRK